MAKNDSASEAPTLPPTYFVSHSSGDDGIVRQLRIALAELDTSLTIDSRALRGGDPLDSTIRTVIETPTFQRQAAKLWSEDERLDFIDWTGHERQGLATTPLRLR